MSNLSIKNNGTQASLGLDTLEQVKFNADGSVEIPDLDNPELAGKLDTANAFGVGQTWQNMTASRSFGVTYTNTTGKPIQVSISGQSSVSAQGFRLLISINSVSFFIANSYSAHDIVYGSGSVTIPVGASYSITSTSSGVSVSWYELRG